MPVLCIARWYVWCGAAVWHSCRRRGVQGAARLTRVRRCCHNCAHAGTIRMYTGSAAGFAAVSEFRGHLRAVTCLLWVPLGEADGR